MEVIYISATRRAVKDALRRLPAVATGVSADPTGLANALRLRLGILALSQIKLDFEIKARGGTGSDNLKWAPLKPSTIARRRNKDKSGIEILRDTGVLFNSLSPGVPGAGGDGAEQIFDATRAGEITIGVRGIKAIHHRGYTLKNGTKVPARSFWPRDGRFPAPWWEPILKAAVSGFATIAMRIMGRMRS